ncbi:MAG: ABC transporter permease [Candidatus Omnitrophica bacterium]|nr:ABC transporter permease [Candidatus Omnitrophota bacterium]
MRFELFLAIRYLRGLRRTQPFTSVIATISILGVAVGVAALIVVLGVMSGFDADLESKIVGSNPHLVVQIDEGAPMDPALLKTIESVPGVVAVSGFAQTQVLLQQDELMAGVILRGIDGAREGKVTRLAESIKQGSWPPAEGQLIVGSELARRWGLSVGDLITVVGGEKGKEREVEVSGIFTTGMYDYDLNLAVCSIGTVQEILGWKERISGIGIRIKEPGRAAQVKQEIRKRIGYPYWVLSWMDMNRNLFAALKLEKLVMFIILTLIVLVACFNIVATLLTLVMRKTKEVGILKSVGATNRSIRWIFTLVGLLIGVLGTALGSAVGVGLCMALAEYQFIQLPPEIYYLDNLPVFLQWKDALAVAASAIGISWLACQYPAWMAARLQPSEAVRYE